MNDIQVVDKDLVDNLTITNYSRDEKHCIVISDICGKKYINYILLNVYVYDYAKSKYTIHDLPCFYKYYKNGFFYYENFYKMNEINEFLEKYNEYFTEKLTTDFMKLSNAIIKEIIRLDKEDKL